MGDESAAIELPQHVLDYMEGHQTLTLATASASGVPRATTLLYVNRGPAMYLWVRPDSTTARNVEGNPLASFAIDEYSEDWRQTTGVQGNGECGVVLGGEEIAKAALLFGQKFPDLASGSSTMGIYFLKFTPTQLQFIDNTRAGEKSAEEFAVDYHSDEVLNVWSDLPGQDVGSIEAQLHSVSAEAGEVLARQGGPADKFFIVVEGELELVHEADGEETQAGTFGPGHFFGEVAIMRDTTRTATVRATKPSKLLSMERDTFQELVGQALGTTGDFDKVIQRRLDSLTG